MAGWIKALVMSSVPVLSSRCLCLQRLFASLPWLSAAGEWTEQSREESQNATCAGIVWFVVILSR